MRKKYTVIFFDQDGKPYKYRNIANYAIDPNEFDNKVFLDFAISKGVVTMNIYEPITRNLKFSLKYERDYFRIIGRAIAATKPQ